MRSNANFIRAKEGYKFTLTEYGFEISRIRVKYQDKSSKARYEKAVPQSWITNGYVKEVERD